MEKAGGGRECLVTPGNYLLPTSYFLLTSCIGWIRRRSGGPLTAFPAQARQATPRDFRGSCSVAARQAVEVGTLKAGACCPDRPALFGGSTPRTLELYFDIFSFVSCFNCDRRA